MLSSPTTKSSQIKESDLQEFLDELGIFSSEDSEKKDPLPLPLKNDSKKNYSYRNRLFIFLMCLFVGLTASWGIHNIFHTSRLVLQELIDETKNTNGYLHEISLKISELSADIKSLESMIKPLTPPVDPSFPKEEIIQPLTPPATDFSVA